MNSISSANVSQGKTDVGGKEITNESPLPVELLNHIFSLLPLSCRINFAKTNYFNLFFFYASSLKGNNEAAVLCRQGMSAVIDRINDPTQINDPYVPCTPKGREYLISRGIGGPRTAQRIQKGLPITVALANSELLFIEEFLSLCIVQHTKFEIPEGYTFAQRVELGQILLTKELDTLFDNPVFKGVLILEMLSKLGHPLAVKAKSILTTWLSDPIHRIWLIIQYITDDQRHYANEIYSSKEIRKLAEIQINIFLQNIETCKDQGDEVAVEKMVNQLIDITLALEYFKDVNPYMPHLREMICSLFYQPLLDCSAIDDVYKDAIRTHKKRIQNPDSRSMLFHHKWYSCLPIRTINDAEHIQKTIQFFKKLSKAGCWFLDDNNYGLKELAYCTIKEAQRIQGSGSTEEVMHLYECAEIAGLPKAKEERLKFLVSLKEDTTLQFELGKLYLDRATKLFLKQKKYIARGGKILLEEQNLQLQKAIWRAQELLENLANKGLVEAAILVAQHYSTFTPHQPKFQPTFFSLKKSDDKAMEFMDIALRSGFENAKDMIYAGEIPTYLEEIVEQIDSTALEIIFNLCKQYEDKWFDTDAHKLAKVLLKIVEGC